MVKLVSKTYRIHSGFTLIELLVVVGIILLITGAGIAGFVTFNDRQQVQTTVKDVQSLMRSAQIKARAGEGANDCVSPGKLKGYQVTQSGTAFVLNRICANPATGAVTSTTQRSQVALEAVTASILNNTAAISSITFLALKGGVEISPVGSTFATINVAGQYSGIEYEFQVLSSGEISEGAFVTGGTEE